MDTYLRSTEILDWDHPCIRDLADNLRATSGDVQDLARRTFEWVRDEIEHSIDFQRDPVTCRASDVLTERTGFCYAKSHLLAALLRANAIPAGLSYQRVLRRDGASFCLHGLNAIYLADWGWYRVDCRGNRPDVDAQFAPPTEQLAFPVRASGEAIFPEVWSDPLPCVVEALHAHSTWLSLAAHLPDVELAGVPRA